MSGTSLVSRVRDLAARAAAGSLEPADVLLAASLLEELRLRVKRLREMGAELEISPEIELLLTLAQPAAIAA